MAREIIEPVSVEVEFEELNTWLDVARKAEYQCLENYPVRACDFIRALISKIERVKEKE